jgi:hypothetical protein
VHQPPGQNGYQADEEHASDDEQAAQGGGFAQRNRLIVGAGVWCFLLGVPLVSLPDGTALSVLGLCLVAIAGACVISLVYRLAGEDDKDEPGRHPED